MPDLSPSAFHNPAVVLAGDVDYEMYERFREAMGRAPETGLVVIALTTLGGDPEVARMMGEDVRFLSDLNPQRRVVFLGKAAVYSAGATFMSFFARENRFLSRGTRLMIHERQMDKTVQITGPLTCTLATAKALLHEIEHSIQIQNEGFENLIAGSSMTLDELLRRAPSNWYVEAQEAVSLRLIEAVI